MVLSVREACFALTHQGIEYSHFALRSLVHLAALRTVGKGVRFDKLLVRSTS